MAQETNADDAIREKREIADALDSLAADLRGADSIADDAPALSELFHEVRTSRRKTRDGRYVALLDYDRDAGVWSCRSVAFLETGTHYRDTGADAVVSHNPFPLREAERFGEVVANALERDAHAARQSAESIAEQSEREQQR